MDPEESQLTYLNLYPNYMYANQKRNSQSYYMDTLF